MENKSLTQLSATLVRYNGKDNEVGPLVIQTFDSLVYFSSWYRSVLTEEKPDIVFLVFGEKALIATKKKQKTFNLSEFGIPSSHVERLVEFKYDSDSLQKTALYINLIQGG
jgi:hypothetical protein